MNKHTTPALFALTLAAASLAFTGCEKKAEKKETAAKPATEQAAAAAPAASAEKPAAAPAKPAEGMETLKIFYPPVDIVGTPVPIKGKVENLNEDVAREVLSPEIAVPAGVKNLAKNKKVTASDAVPIVGELTFVTDGDKDAGEGYEVEFAPGSQWVQIDLEKSATIYAIQVWHYHRQKRAYKAVTVQISDDPEFKTGVTTVFNTDAANINKRGAGKDSHYIETNYGKLIKVEAVQGRYVRLYSAGNTSNIANHYVEVEVFGK